jgi:hypothetical protein
MKKYIVGLMFGLVLLPAVTFADTQQQQLVSALTSLINLLEQQVMLLQQEYAQMIASSTATTAPTVNNVITNISAQIASTTIPVPTYRQPVQTAQSQPVYVPYVPPAPDCSIVINSRFDNGINPPYYVYTLTGHNINKGGLIMPYNNEATTSNVILAYEQTYNFPSISGNLQFPNAPIMPITEINPNTTTLTAHFDPIQSNTLGLVATVFGVGGMASCQATSPIPIISSDATLKNLTIDGTPVPGFNPNIYTYTFTISADRVVSPLISGVLNDPNASGWGQSTNSLATFTVTAQDGITKNIYTVNFQLSTTSQ